MAALEAQYNFDFREIETNHLLRPTISVFATSEEVRRGRLRESCIRGLAIGPNSTLFHSDVTDAFRPSLYHWENADQIPVQNTNFWFSKWSLDVHKCLDSYWFRLLVTADPTSDETTEHLQALPLVWLVLAAAWSLWESFLSVDFSVLHQHWTSLATPLAVVTIPLKDIPPRFVKLYQKDRSFKAWTLFSLLLVCLQAALTWVLLPYHGNFYFGLRLALGLCLCGIDWMLYRALLTGPGRRNLFACLAYANAWYLPESEKSPHLRKRHRRRRRPQPLDVAEAASTVTLV